MDIMNNEKEHDIKFADKIAAFSKDQSSKVGAYFTDPEKMKEPCFGYNGMPRGLDDTNPERNQRPEKYFWYEHAERNGFYNKAREKLEGAIIFSSAAPNMEAARAIVSSGIKTVVIEYVEESQRVSEEQKAMYERVKTLFGETHVNVIELDRIEIEAGFNPYHANLNLEDDDAMKKAIKEFSLKEKYLRYLDLAYEYGQEESQHPTNKSGALILNAKTLNPLGMGAFNPPHKMVMTEEMKQPENIGYYFQEAEKVAILETVRSYFKGMVMDVNLCPCDKCALATAAVEVSKVNTRAIDFTQEVNIRWRDAFLRTEQIFKASGVELNMHEVPSPEVKVRKKLKY
jgi:dCMP deaminase